MKTARGLVWMLLWAGVALGADKSFVSYTEDYGEPGDKAPVIKPWKQIPLDSQYGGYWIVTGDVDGDGEADIVSARNVDKDDVHYTSTAVAQRLDGSVIWRWGDPNIGDKKLRYDVACQIYDWNGIGRSEVILCTKGYLVELDGATGKERRRLRIPADASDCLVFANLSGNKKVTDVLVKTRYSQIWAYNYDGKLLWTVSYPGGRRTAHQPRPIDIDNDGKDEIMAGYAMLNSDGSVRWQFKSGKMEKGKGHLDCCRVLRKGKTPQEYRLVLTCCQGNNLACVDGNGKILWEVPGYHFQSVQAGRIYPDLPGPQIIVDIDHSRRGQAPLWLLDANGRQLGRIMTDYCRQHALLDWDGDGYEEIIIAFGHGVFDGAGKRIATFQTKGSGGTLLLGDMTGDGVSDVTILARTPAIVYIFKNEKGKEEQETSPLGCGVNFTLY
ncbi:MAG TPA: hypothetical protein VMW16_09510 [Sedimentisphaerales bacterium]|nr:hypothetical protein [Sedimentisphaerales bacterium]